MTNINSNVFIYHIFISHGQSLMGLHQEAQPIGELREGGWEAGTAENCLGVDRFVVIM